MFTQSYGAISAEVAPVNPDIKLPEIDCPGFKIRLERKGCYKEKTDGDGSQRTLPIQV